MIQVVIFRDVAVSILVATYVLFLHSQLTFTVIHDLTISNACFFCCFFLSVTLFGASFTQVVLATVFNLKCTLPSIDTPGEPLLIYHS